MIHRFEYQVARHQLGSSFRFEFPVSPAIGDIKGVACLIKNRTVYFDQNGREEAGDIIEPDGVLSVMASFSTEEGDVIASCSVSEADDSTLNKRTVPVDYKKPFGRLCVVVDEPFNAPTDDEEERILRASLNAYSLVIYLITRKAGEQC